MEFDHISGVRQAVVEGLGWSILPYYAIEDEVNKKLVSCVNGISLAHTEEFQLWWVPGRLHKKTLATLVEQFSN
jgi:DNA-binding transcriptional LysR family regulator